MVPGPSCCRHEPRTTTEYPAELAENRGVRVREGNGGPHSFSGESGPRGLNASQTSLAFRPWCRFTYLRLKS
jgi:hypothetical protein